MRSTLWLAAVLLAAAPLVRGDEIGLIEDFALAPDRTTALQELVPGTEDYYYYHCLHHLNIEQFDKVEGLLDTWVKRLGETDRAREIRSRLALLTYALNPQKSLEWLQRELGLRFDHQREVRGEAPDLPVRLDPRLIDRDELTKRALSRYENLQGFEDRAVAALVGADLTPAQRRHLLQRLARPDCPGLEQVVIEDLRDRTSGGFGSLPIHGELLLSQLNRCAELQPELRKVESFVSTYLAKLRPSDDVDWTQDVPAKSAYLDRLWEFVKPLDPAYNSLKAHVLYHRLHLDRSQGSYDKQRFLTYLALPRRVPYMRAEYLQEAANRRFPADLGADYSAATGLPPVRSDEELVRDYLEQFFLTETTYEVYAPFINDAYLKHLFAEVKLLNGLGDAERWAAMLPPESYQALKERVDLIFDPANRRLLRGSEPVSLDLHVKNVATLIVKIFEINTRNVYVETQREVDTDISLDGLVPNEELTFQYGEPPLRRVRRHFEFPSLAKPGVYVIDFIGSGKSSRALVRKGDLDLLERLTPAGHLFTVVDEDLNDVTDATLWVAGHEYAPDEHGRFFVPFTTRPTSQPIVISRGDFAVLKGFDHKAEQYLLRTGIHVDRESLIAGARAKVLVRPYLTLAETPVTLSVLEDVRLVLTSADHDGVTTTQESAPFELFEDRESVHEFQVPARLSQLNVALKARVQLLTEDRKADLLTHETFSLNEIDRTEKIEDLHLGGSREGLFLELLGKNGEPRAQRPVALSLKHRDFTDTVDVALQTDERGRIELGSLEGIDWVRCSDPSGTAHTWPLLRDRHTYSGLVHGKAGEVLEIPFMKAAGEMVPGGVAEKLSRAEAGLLELRSGTPAYDRFENLSLANGCIELRGLAPGDYDLFLARTGERLRIRIGKGEERKGYLLGSLRRLELRNQKPLQIAAIDVADDELRVRLRNPSPFARVHVFANRYHPAYPPYQSLGFGDVGPDAFNVRQPESLFVEGRRIGDEYQYIIDRKYARKFPGNMLERPSLLLNPWAVRSTETGEQLAEEGEAFRKTGAGPRAGRGRPGPSKEEPAAGGDFSSLDFLAEAAAVLVNLRPDESGTVHIARKDLGAHQEIHVVAVEPLGTAYRSVMLPEPKLSVRDLRLAQSLDPEAHFSQQKQISVLRGGESLVLGDFTASRVETYDSLARIYGYYLSLTSDPKLAEFGFVTNWPELKEEQKRDMFSRYACHELSFFLFKKDPEFFAKVIQPNLRNKKEKTFLDEWLLGDDLTRHLDPWAYAQLNVVERILLAQRVPAEQLATAREIADLADLVPPDSEQFNFRFETGLRGRALEAGGGLGLEEAKEELARERLGELEDRGEAPGAPATAAEPVAPQEGGKGVRRKEARLRAGLEKGEEPVRDKAAGYFDEEKEARKDAERFYRKADKTQEWAENNYYKIPIEEQNAGLVTANPFWRDYAGHDRSQPFFSPYFIEAAGSFTEMMLALAVLDVPFKASESRTSFDGKSMTLGAQSPMIVFHEEVKPAAAVSDEKTVLVSQNTYRYGERYRFEGNERLDNYVTGEFLTHTVYGCEVVVTNPTSSKQKLDVLLQIPMGAVPVLNGRAIRSVHLDLDAYRTQTLDYAFYFPRAGKFTHYPVQVASGERHLAQAEAKTLEVLEAQRTVDRGSWDYVSQQGSLSEVLDFLRAKNLFRTDLERIAFRMREKEAFDQVLGVLTARHVYQQTLWSYSLMHNAAPRIREFLQHCDVFVAQCGAAIESPLLTIDPVIRKSYQHLEYKPLINARAHRLGGRREILNDRFHEQYQRLLAVLSCRRVLDDDDLMSVVYYLLLQDRVEEALAFFGRVNPQNLETRLQYDYLAAYVDFFTPGLDGARRIVAAYENYPVDRWREAFGAIKAQLLEVEGGAPGVVDTESREQVQTRLAHAEPSFDIALEGGKLRIDYQNLDRVRVHFYLMDIELLFSRNPFVQEFSGQFSFIRPNLTQDVTLPEGGHFEGALPENLQNRNVLVEVSGGGKTRSATYYSNSLSVQVLQSYGQVRVLHRDSRKPLATVYVKAYALMDDETVRFYKDGYTDQRGRFDYASLSTDELDHVSRFSLLILSDDHGAVVREALPPKQ
ncbi:MAG: hypothetical protein AB1486_01525 [Planctomycetota bacterium]